MSEAGDNVRLRAAIHGAVQGVGFRPFVYRLAAELGVTGDVSNTTEGAVLEAEGPRPVLETLLRRLEAERPPLSIIESIETDWRAATGVLGFHIRHSDAAGEITAQVLPDIATCPDCLREIFDPNDRRYHYPFTNCTHCGPRFSIIENLPYDRPNTSMKAFSLCDVCRAEYDDPSNRRFHAQPTACPVCGPKLAWWNAAGEVLTEGEEALQAAAGAIRAGSIVAVKGLGGFHLVTDARNDEAVARLRQHKHREEKPFALMYPDLKAVRGDCVVSPLEQCLLESPESPIVLLERAANISGVSESAAPGAPNLGVLLPYTPLHHLLLRELAFPIVATSGNLNEEPICTDENEAVWRLKGIAEGYLVHNRPIVRHVDDSIVRVAGGREMVLRRARGYAPLPIRVAPLGPSLAAVGGHLKNTVAVSKRGQVYLSQHIGDLSTSRAFDAFVEALTALRTLYQVPVHSTVCDMHPDYLSTQYAHGLGRPTLAVQHHYAHVLAVLAEHGLEGPVLGVAWDGTGYGPDGTTWGGEFFKATREDFARIARIRPFPLPGGEKAVTEPRRSAMGLLYAALGAEALDREDLPPVQAFGAGERRTIAQMLHRGINSPMTSSAGRLFDAVASLLGLHQKNAYEGQAAMSLEYAARRAGSDTRRTIEVSNNADEQTLLSPPLKGDLGGCYGVSGDSREENTEVAPWSCDFGIEAWESGWELNWAPMLHHLLEAHGGGISQESIAAGFHAALARGILEIARRASLPEVVLTGGCFQNTFLLETAIGLLREAGFTVYWHHRVPPNDGGIALGQAAYAVWQELRNVSSDSR